MHPDQIILHLFRQFRLIRCLTLTEWVHFFQRCIDTFGNTGHVALLHECLHPLPAGKTGNHLDRLQAMPRYPCSQGAVGLLYLVLSSVASKCT